MGLVASVAEPYSGFLGAAAGTGLEGPRPAPLAGARFPISARRALDGFSALVPGPVRPPGTTFSSVSLNSIPPAPRRGELPAGAITYDTPSPQEVQVGMDNLTNSLIRLRMTMSM